MPHTFPTWDATLEVSSKRLVGDVVLKFQRTMVFLALGAAVEISPGNVKKILGVVLRTPVMDGRARASWNVSVGTPNGDYPDVFRRTYKPLTATQGSARAALRGLGPYEVVWITSGLPYIRVLEYGLYPKPPRLGTLVKNRKGQRHFEIRSAGGFSKQAPQGMVRITYDEMLEIARGGG
jgi:hypothetical protein